MKKREEILEAVANVKAGGVAVEADLLHVLISVSLDIRELLQEQSVIMKHREAVIPSETMAADMQELASIARSALVGLGTPPVGADVWQPGDEAPGALPVEHEGVDRFGIPGFRPVHIAPDLSDYNMAGFKDPLQYFSWVKEVGEFAALRIYLSEGFMKGARGAIANPGGEGEPVRNAIVRNEVVIIHDRGGEAAPSTVRLSFEEFLSRVFEPKTPLVKPFVDPLVF